MVSTKSERRCCNPTLNTIASRQVLAEQSSYTGILTVTPKMPGRAYS